MSIFLTMEEVGERIKIRRKNCNLTQNELAELIGKTESSIRKYEKGIVDIPNSTMVSIAKALGTTTDYLYGVDKIKYDVTKTSLLLKQLKLLDYDLDSITEARTSEEEAIESSEIPQYYYLKVKGKEIHIPCEVIERLEDDNLSYLKYRIEEIIGTYSK